MSSNSNGHTPPLADSFGVCQWFHFKEYGDVDLTLRVLSDLGIRNLRTGISWADFLRPGGSAWYDWQMDALQEAGLDILLSVWHTPPSLSENGRCAGPPRVLKDYADFVDVLITKYGDRFHALELWNEPNNRYKWDFLNCDPGWRKFGEMLVLAGNWAKRRQRKTVLGGMIPVDHTWLGLMEKYGVLEYIDVVALHGFPEMWWDDAPNWDWHTHWSGWAERIAYISRYTGGRPIWITETGLATWEMDDARTGRHDLQVRMLERAVTAPAERVYWYCARDLPPDREAIEGFHVDENEYHMGLVTADGTPKPAYFRLKELMRESSAEAGTIASAQSRSR